MRHLFVLMLATACSPALADLSFPGQPTRRQASAQRPGQLGDSGLNARAWNLVTPRDLWDSVLPSGSQTADRGEPAGDLRSALPPAATVTRGGPLAGPQTAQDATLGYGTSAFGIGEGWDGSPDAPPLPLKGSPLRTPGRDPSPAYLRPPKRSKEVLPTPSAALLGAVGLSLIARIRRRPMA